MKKKKKKTIKLSSILDQIGAYKIRTSNHEVWYLSPFRKEQTASFKVDLRKNVFYDFGEGFGGTTLDFVMQYYQCDIPNALKILREDFNSFSFHQPITVSSNIIQELIYTIQVIKPLTHPNLIQYVNERNLSLKMAQTYCKEVHYTLNNKSYYAVGFQNELGDFELRNRYVKMCLGKKAVTYFDNKSENIVLYESWSDYISFLSLYPNAEKQYDFLILNSVSMLNNTIIKTPNNYLYKCTNGEIRKNVNAYLCKELKYDKIICCFDNDKAGENAFQKVAQVYINAIDGRKLYGNHKDLNDYLLTINHNDLT